MVTVAGGWWAVVIVGGGGVCLTVLACVDDGKPTNIAYKFSSFCFPVHLVAYQFACYLVVDAYSLHSPEDCRRPVSMCLS